MRVPEAMQKLAEIRDRAPGHDVWRKDVMEVLDAVWLEAYEGGVARLFEAPEAEHHYNGRHAHPAQ